MTANTTYAQDALTSLAGVPADRDHCQCPTALAEALMSDRAGIPASVKQKLQPLVGKYLT